MVNVFFSTKFCLVQLFAAVSSLSSFQRFVLFISKRRWNGGRDNRPLSLLIMYLLWEAKQCTNGKKANRKSSHGKAWYWVECCCFLSKVSIKCRKVGVVLSKFSSKMLWLFTRERGWVQLRSKFKQSSFRSRYLCHFAKSIF